MAQIGTEDVNKTFNKHNRAWRTTIDTPFVSSTDREAYKAAIRLISHREIVLADPDTGEKFSDVSKYDVHRSFEQVKDNDAPIVDMDGALVGLPAAADENSLGVYDRGDGTYSVRINGAMLFAAVSYMADVMGITADENPENV